MASRYYEQAHLNVPGWEAPLLRLGEVSLQLGDLDGAVSWYQRAEVLPTSTTREPAAVQACVAREREERLEAGTCARYAATWREPGRVRRASLESLLATEPDLAPAWADLVALLDDPALQLAAIEEGLAQDPDPATYGILMVHRTMLMRQGY